MILTEGVEGNSSPADELNPNVAAGQDTPVPAHFFVSHSDTVEITG